MVDFEEFEKSNFIFKYGLNFEKINAIHAWEVEISQWGKNGKKSKFWLLAKVWL